MLSVLGFLQDWLEAPSRLRATRRTMVLEDADALGYFMEDPQRVVCPDTVPDNILDLPYVR